MSYEYLHVDHIFHMAWVACVDSPGYDKQEWKDMEHAVAAAISYSEQTGRDQTWSALELVGDLLRKQGGDPRRIVERLDASLKNARQVTADLKVVQNQEAITVLSRKGCYAWTEVERLRKVLGLPEGGG